MKFIYLVIMTIILLMNNSCSNNIISIESKSVYKTQDMGFPQANIYNGLLFTSGQVGWDTNFKLTGTGSFRDQLTQTFVNINQILKESGSNFDDVIMMRIYVVGLNKQKRMEVGNIIKKHYSNTHKPASSLIGVNILAREDLLVEIEIIAKTNK